MAEQEDPRLTLPVPWIQLDKAPISINNPENDLGTGRADSTQPTVESRPQGRGREGQRLCPPARGSHSPEGERNTPTCWEAPHPGKMKPHDI